MPACVYDARMGGWLDKHTIVICNNLKDVMLSTGVVYKTVRAITNCDVAQWTTMDFNEISKNDRTFQQIVKDLHKVVINQLVCMFVVQSSHYLTIYLLICLFIDLFTCCFLFLGWYFVLKLSIDMQMSNLKK